MSKSEVLIKIADHHAELSKLYRQLSEVDFQSPTIRARESGSNELNVKCGCGKQAKRVEGKAKTGRNAGDPYVMYVCAEPKDSRDNCGFRKFEDQLLKEGGAM